VERVEASAASDRAASKLKQPAAVGGCGVEGSELEFL